MKMRTNGPSLATRAAALTLAGALFAGCSANHPLLPAVPGSAPGAAFGRDLDGNTPDRSGGKVRVLLQIRIPRHTRRRGGLHPGTVSSLTHSITVSVNSAKAQVFNTTTTSPDCTTGSAGTTCTFAVAAPAETDTFTVTTYGGVNATGTALDRGIALKVPIAKGKANHVAIRLGPLVTTTADAATEGSLRYAIATASNGDTITFALPNPSTITLGSPIVLKGTLTIAGPGASGVIISGGGAHQLFKIEGNATISGLTLAHGKAVTAGQPGGAIFNTGALTLASDTIGSNSSTVALRRVPVDFHSLRMRRLHPHCSSTPAEGGAIFNSGMLTMSSTTFTGNTISNNAATCIVGEGGAIYNAPTAILSSTHDTFSANAAEKGGAVYSASIGAATFTSDAFTNNTGCTAATGCPNSACGATSCTTSALGEGAAIYDAGIGIQVTGTSFTGNVAGGKTAGSAGEGGAIYLNSTFPSITHSTFTSNLAGGGTASCSSGIGGAIFSTNALEIDNDTFTTNHASGDSAGGGGAVVSAAAVTGTGDTFSGNTANGTGGPCTTSSNAIGGAVYTAGVATFTGSTFTGNLATGTSAGEGGAIAAQGVAFDNCTFTSNVATGTGTNGAASSGAIGGAVLIGNAASSISGSTFTSNSAKAEGSTATEGLGGAVAVESGTSTLPFNQNTFTSNSASSGGTGIAAGGAVAIASSSENLESTRDTFSKNWAASPTGTAISGAEYVAGAVASFYATMTSNSVSGKTAESGALGIAGAGSSLYHITMTGNSASGTTIGVGGALLDSAGATVLFSNISGNSATQAAGGIFIQTNSETIAYSSVNGNVVSKANGGLGGGAIANAGGLTMESSTVSGNSVTVSGAGPGGGGGLLNIAALALFGSTVSGNKVIGSAASGGGGAMFDDNTVNATNSTISNNSSSLAGGGIFNNSASSGTFDNVTFFKNAATKQGGNIYNASSSFTLNQSVVGGGTGSAGPDIDNPGTITSGGYNIIQTAAAGTAIAAATGDLTADPKLLALSANGGPTYTNADQSTSPGKGHIPYSGGNCGSVSMTTDQRGYARGNGSVCDSGAYEYAGTVSAARRRPLPKAASRHAGKTLIPFPRLAAAKIVVDM